MPYFLAIDSGGTKAAFLLAEDARELKRTTVGTIKRVNADAAEAAQNVATALAELEAATGVRMDQIACTCIGTSGDAVPLVTDWLREEFSRRVSGSLILLSDVEIALDAVFEGKRGILAISGTGSNIAGRASNGTITTAGGWGPMLADQGAGHWIGMEGLRRGFLARDEQRPTILLEAARKLWDLPSIDALIEFANAQPAARYGAQFAKEVVACANQGDAIAIEILEQGGKEIAYLCSLVIERIRTTEGGESFDPPPVAIVGSILVHVERVRASMQRALRERYPTIQFVETPADASRGALWHAIRGK